MSDNPESNVLVPTRIWVQDEGLEHLRIHKYGKAAGVTIYDFEGLADESVTEYLRSDIAKAQTNKRVREVLRRLMMMVNGDTNITTDSSYAAIQHIDSILNEYPDLLTNEEEKS